MRTSHGLRLTGVTVVIVLVAGISGCGAAHRTAGPPATRLCGQAGWPEASVGGGAYVVQNDEWNSTAPECITTNGHAQFTVASSSIQQGSSGDPGGYPSIFAGCSAGVCTAGTKLPVRVRDLKPGTITSSWATAQTAGGAYDVAYDIWFNRTPASAQPPDGGELMIWLAHRGGSQISPAGEPTAHVSLGGYTYTLWVWQSPDRNYRISYVMDRPAQSVRGLDVSAIVNDAARRGYLIGSYYLLNVQAGFELWQGGSGLETTSFAINVRR